MKRLIRTIFSAALLCEGLLLNANGAAPSGRFRPVVPPSGQVTSVFTITQDESGYIWMGTDQGLFRYDGFDFINYRWNGSDSLSLVNNLVNTLACSRGLLYIGTDSGISIYDPATDRFRTVPGSPGKHVKSLHIEGDSVYAATTTGLYLYNKGAQEKLLDGHFTVIRPVEGQLWAGSYSSIYSFREGVWTRHDLSGSLSGRDLLVLDICRDAREPEALWIGTEAGLLHYDTATSTCSWHLLKDTPVKTFLYCEDDLWLGTDSGAAVLQDGKRQLIFRHDITDVASIPDNVVWALARDHRGNIWLGTDHGAAITDTGQSYRFTGLNRITGQTDGLDVGLMTFGSDGNLWLAGRNGLICSSPALDRGFNLKADSPSSHGKLSHNKVRGLFDDGRRLWIASDGGLDCFDYASRKVRNFRVTEPTGRYSSNWMYTIAEDRFHRLWLGTYDGGVFIVDKQRLLAGRAGVNVTCDLHLSRESAPALRSDVVHRILIRDDKAYLVYGNSLDIIGIPDGRGNWPDSGAQKILMPSDDFILTLKEDGEDIWIGTDRYLYRLDAQNRLEHIEGLEDYILSLDVCDGKVWIAGKNVIASYRPDTGELIHFPTDGLPLMSVCHTDDRILFGTVDGILEAPRGGQAPAPASGHRVAITELRTDDEVICAGLENGISLPADRNSFTLTLSSFSYGSRDDIILYRLRGFDDTWRKLERDENRAGFINVPSGSYDFEFGLKEDVDRGEWTAVSVDIAHPWYRSTLAYLLYALAFIILCYVAFYSLSMQHRLRMEHEERQRAIAMADSKTEFLANIAHEFKSPLSIILSFIGQLTAHESDSIRTRELQAVQKNAEKMNLLLHNMAEFNSDGSSPLFVPTPVSITDFARDVWNRYCQAFLDKDINYRFISDRIDYMFLIDKVQMESALQNLLSNALKFTPRGGSILMSVTRGEDTSDMLSVDIRVEDTGCGIPEDELPKIFNRYYCGVSSRELNPGGTGIGLDLVKQAVEMHRGHIGVSSVPGKGSCFTVSLSTMKSDSLAIRDTREEESVSMYSLSQVWQHHRKPNILLVEDNPDIRDLLVASLGRDYVLFTAEEGEAGLNVLKSEKIDLVVTDIAMPGMDGLEMSRTVRNSLDTAFLPIIILTGRDDAQTRISSYEYADAFIAKPFDINYLNGVIIKLLIKHEQYLDKIRRQKVTTPQAEDVESPDENFLKEMMAIISAHIDDSEFTAAALHEESHWSEKQIYRKIKQLTGKTVSEFIRDVRMDKAAAYLSQGKLTVKEVMFKVGYTTQSYFTKCFKERFGILPSEYTQKGTEAD